MKDENSNLFKYFCVSAVVVVIIVLVCGYLYNKKLDLRNDNKSVASSDIGVHDYSDADTTGVDTISMYYPYLYMDNKDALHSDKGCGIIFQQMESGGSPAVRRIPVEKLQEEDMKKCCPVCIGDDLYEGLMAYINK